MKNGISKILKTSLVIYFLSLAFLFLLLDGYSSNKVTYDDHFTVDQFLVCDKTYRDDLKSTDIGWNKSLDANLGLKTLSLYLISSDHKSLYLYLNSRSLLILKLTNFIRAPSFII